MSRFDEQDARAAAAVGRLLNEAVIWRPMVAPTGGQYVQGAPTPDSSRPVRGEAPNDPLLAVVTWNMGTAPVTPGAGGGTIGTAKLLLDFEVAAFPDGNFPRRYDRMELTEETDEANATTEVQRVESDGSSRVLVWCTVARAA